jgi:hypothetical protein
LGGDADTQGAISGAIAAAKMPIPQVEADICYESLPTELKKTVTDFYEFLSNGVNPKPTKIPEDKSRELSTQPISDASEEEAKSKDSK